MAAIDPVVRHMLLCDDVRPDPDNPHRLDVFGLASTLRVLAGAFPFVHAELCVLMMMTEVRAEGWGSIVVVDAESALAIFSGSDHRILPASSPLDLVAAVFRIRNCRFPAPGLYEVQFRYNGKVLAQQPLFVR